MRQTQNPSPTPRKAGNLRKNDAKAIKSEQSFTNTLPLQLWPFEIFIIIEQVCKLYTRNSPLKMRPCTDIPILIVLYSESLRNYTLYHKAAKLFGRSPSKHGSDVVLHRLALLGLVKIDADNRYYLTSNGRSLFSTVEKYSSQAVNQRSKLD